MVHVTLVAGSTSLYPALAFEYALAECLEGPFKSLASLGRIPQQGLLPYLGCLPPSLALTEAKVKPVEVAPAAAFPNTM